jgi:hypothetical protein
VYDVMPQVLWTQYFLQQQGYRVNHNTIYQDNMSAMLLEINGKRSSSNRTRHIDIRYFFMKDCIDNDDVTLQYCPTQGMIADFFTKPLQEPCSPDFEMP